MCMPGRACLGTPPVDSSFPWLFVHRILALAEEFHNLLHADIHLEGLGEVRIRAFDENAHAPAAPSGEPAPET